MNNVNLYYKLNALVFISIAALLVFMPQQSIAFLSQSTPIPQVLVLVIGVVLNLLGLLLLWLGKQPNPKPQWLRITAVLNLVFVTVLLVSMATQNWITSINGITTAGVVTILIGWIGWSLWQQH